MLLCYIKQTTAIKAGFNWPAYPDMSLIRKNGLYIVYHSYRKKKNLNIMIIEEHNFDNPNKREFYFATLNSSNILESYKIDRENARCQLSKLIKRRNRTSAGNLESKLLELIK